MKRLVLLRCFHCDFANDPVTRESEHNIIRRSWTTNLNRYRIILALIVFLTGFSLFAGENGSDSLLFRIGYPDGRSSEFGNIHWNNVVEEKRNPTIDFTVGESPVYHWPHIHISTRDMKNAGHRFTFRIHFNAERDYPEPLYFTIGVCFSHATEPSRISIDLNGKHAEARAPVSTQEAMRKGFNTHSDHGTFQPVVIPIAPATVKQGQNTLDITLDDGSWIYYDYLQLSTKAEPPQELPPPDLLSRFKVNEFKEQGIHEILFVVRKPGTDPHWYANFGYYSQDDHTYPFPLGTGARLCILNLDDGKVRTLFETKTGSIRDPQIHYSGKKFVFSYIPDGKKHFNLYEMNTDGSGLRQITSGDWDDIEPAYLPNGDIVFCSSRCKRWVQCWLTPVATIHRCGPNGENIRELSCNIEHDNTPWVISNGQIMYMRWEYIDRSQVHYHHLWTMNPDGTRQQIYFGNQTPGRVFIDAKPIPGSDRVVVIFSPGHGIKEHYGQVALLSPRKGPDDESSVFYLTQNYQYADPWAFSENAFMAASHHQLKLIDPNGFSQVIYALEGTGKPDEFWIHEPRPIIGHDREPIIAENVDLSKNVGHLILTNIYDGRQMKDVKPGSIRELLVIETLPEPVHYNGGMEQITTGGTFTLQRILGTVPVQPDGSVYMELPALRPFFFVALDHEGKPVKRMHSFTSVMPGETTTCIGCHEDRTDAPPNRYKNRIFEMTHRGPVSPQPIKDIPDVFSFPRDIQPILDKHCVSCHNYDRPDGGVDLCGDWNIRYSMSYNSLSSRNMFGDNRNRPVSNFSPYQIGSSASPLYKLIESNHQGAKLSDHEKKMIRFWLDTGAVYAGTYAANGHTIFRHYYESPIREDLNWPEVAAMNSSLQKRCDSCHEQRKSRLPHSLSPGDSRYNVLRIYNLSHPEKSHMLRAPLAQEAGGFARCKTKEGKPIFADRNDPDYKIILAAIERGRHFLTEESQRFSLNRPIVPPKSYIREMIRFGVLPPDYDYKTPVDPYQIDQKYWRSLWYKPQLETRNVK